MNKYKTILILSFVTPLILSFCFSYLYKHEYLYYYIIPFLAVVNELAFLKETDCFYSKHIKDKGIISAFVIAVIYSFIICIVSKYGVGGVSLFISLLFISIGSWLRSLSKIYLGYYFSHSIRVEKDHKLIKDRIFKYIRHPAYTGTLFILFGFSLMINIVFAIFIFILFFILALKRIEKEEDLLVRNFGNEYLEYRNYSWKLFPFII
ncbi:protein-S-isoprenylcysteine O-methyltransferase Ste14 [Nicoletella semolina]|uniref:Protein-S-isoprenylcysteine O-methyltransferase Ste14 n=1 Tax=Nicoletella semolina TaxID=271160 RepID=A0A4R2NBQ7_9PAST|nr:isoprenylcysteine carboxylmethyltransferase family protein [Nicoletella semolina]MDH2924893.1 hypothetical protein [Nicoletella semolina]TCP18435.1 protein-S-isoprenylcysteine O-methyltransferase Ste14 [Nicoletella semolina]